jgi:hypothetical protein
MVKAISATLSTVFVTGRGRRKHYYPAVHCIQDNENICHTNNGDKNPSLRINFGKGQNIAKIQVNCV